MWTVKVMNYTMIYLSTFKWVNSSFQRNITCIREILANMVRANLDKPPKLGFPAGCLSWDCCGHGALKTSTGKVRLFQTSDHPQWFCEKSLHMVHILLAFAAWNMALQPQWDQIITSYVTENTSVHAFHYKGMTVIPLHLASPYLFYQKSRKPQQQ